MGIFKKINGMDIVGQGGKIILFMLPALVAAILLHIYLPSFAAMPAVLSFLKPLGYVLLAPGLVLWISAVITLLVGFPKGKLITSGPYSVVRNPIYSSVALFVLPGLAFVSQTWVYFVAAAFLYAGVMIFIGVEERKLGEVFGSAYTEYTARVHRLIPFIKPGK